MTNAVPDKEKTALSIKFDLDSAILTEKFLINQLTKVIQMLENTDFTSDIAPIFFNSTLEYLEVN